MHSLHHPHACDQLTPQLVHYRVLKEALLKDGLVALVHPQQIRDVASANLFISASDGFIAYENTTVVPHLVRQARGKVLELGPGPGNQIHRFDPSLVDTIYGIEPNPHYRDAIALKLKKHDLQDRYKLLTCGIEDADVLEAEGIAEGSIDTVLSIQVLCSVQDVEMVMRTAWKLLKPGGCFVFWEHGRSRDGLTGLVQGKCWLPSISVLALDDVQGLIRE